MKESDMEKIKMDMVQTWPNGDQYKKGKLVGLTNFLFSREIFLWFFSPNLRSNHIERLYQTNWKADLLIHFVSLIYQHSFEEFFVKSKKIKWVFFL